MYKVKSKYDEVTVCLIIALIFKNFKWCVS
jgi:hypothetical protein